MVGWICLDWQSDLGFGIEFGPGVELDAKWAPGVVGGGERCIGLPPLRLPKLLVKLVLANFQTL